jgi:hypothetical protein
MASSHWISSSSVFYGCGPKYIFSNLTVKCHSSRFFRSKLGVSVFNEISFIRLRARHVEREHEEDDLPSAAESHISSTRFFSCIVAKCLLRSSKGT